jgi:hypothetical protein
VSALPIQTRRVRHSRLAGNRSPRSRTRTTRLESKPFFLDNPRTLEDGIAFAETVLKDCRRGFLRAEVKNIRTLDVLWKSVPVLRPTGVR